MARRKRKRYPTKKPRSMLSPGFKQVYAYGKKTKSGQRSYVLKRHDQKILATSVRQRKTGPLKGKWVGRSSTGHTIVAESLKAAKRMAAHLDRK